VERGFEFRLELRLELSSARRELFRLTVYQGSFSAAYL
jgi:hypothetical protein